MSMLGRQWKQLDMYKTAKELRHGKLLDVEANKVFDKMHSTHLTPEHVIEQQVMDQKLNEAKSTGLYDSIKNSGVLKPVYVSRNKHFGDGVLGDGHHRIAAAHDIDPNMLIPVEHG